MKTATGNAVLRAYSSAVKSIQNDGGVTATSHSAGFIIPNGQKKGVKKGFQVFVRVCRYSDELLKANPETGGLICP